MMSVTSYLPLFTEKKRKKKDSISPLLRGRFGHSLLFFHLEFDKEDIHKSEAMIVWEINDRKSKGPMHERNWSHVKLFYGC